MPAQSASEDTEANAGTEDDAEAETSIAFTGEHGDGWRQNHGPERPGRTRESCQTNQRNGR